MDISSKNITGLVCGLEMVIRDAGTNIHLECLNIEFQSSPNGEKNDNHSQVCNVDDQSRGPPS